MKKIKIFFIALLIFLNINFLYACSSDSSDIPKIEKNTDSANVKIPNTVEETFSIYSSVESGEYDEPFMLNLSTNKDNSTIYYSFDKKNYDINSFSKYETPIIIDKDTFIRFYGVHIGEKTNAIEKEFKVKINTDKKNISLKNKDIKEYIKEVKINPPKKNISLPKATPSPSN